LKKPGVRWGKKKKAGETRTPRVYASPPEQKAGREKNETTGKSPFLLGGKPRMRERPSKNTTI